MPAHGLDQLVDLLVVFQGIPQSLFSAEQPLAKTAHFWVQGRGVQHGVPTVVRWRPFPTLKCTQGQDLLLNHAYHATVYVINTLFTEHIFIFKQIFSWGSVGTNYFSLSKPASFCSNHSWANLSQFSPFLYLYRWYLSMLKIQPIF